MFFCLSIYILGENYDTNRRFRKEINATRIVLVFATIYMVSYITLINFGAIVAEIEQAIGSSKNLLSLSLTGSFITYEIGQILSGIAADQISPKKLISIGLIVTATMNFLTTI